MIVEDNTGLSNADTYIDPDGALEYFEKYGGGDSFIEMEEEKQEQALRNGTRIVDGLIRWTGSKLNEDQALEWPRTKESDTGSLVVMEVPKEVKESVCDLANLWITGDISTPPVIKESYGDTSVTYAYPHAQTDFLDIKKRLLKYGAFKATVVTTYRA
jgi:hypothetical protein